MTRQVRADNNAQQDVFVIVSEIQQMTIGNEPSSVGTAAPSIGTNVAQPNFGTYNAGSAPSASNQTQILPAGSSAPNFDNTEVDQDPAIIIEENQAVFVDFVSQ